LNSGLKVLLFFSIKRIAYFLNLRLTFLIKVVYLSVADPPIQKTCYYLQKEKDYNSELLVIEDVLTVLENNGISHETDKKNYNEMEKRKK